MRILFWGTPEFALTSLRALESEGHHIAGVVTQPDRPAGRGRHRTPSPVRTWADQEGYRVLTPERPRGDDFMSTLAEIRPEISVVVAYGHILSAEVLAAPVHGSINVHASLLPELRGAAPIHWAIARGYTRTGVTIMRMNTEMDAGPILLQAEEPIGARDTMSALTNRLAELGAELLVEALALLEAGQAEEGEQEHARATFAPKVDRSVARVDWTRPASELDCHIRGMDAAPGAWSELDGHAVKLFEPTAQESEDSAEPGTILVADVKRGLVIRCGAGALALGAVQPAGKGRIKAVEWIQGRGAEAGRRFS